MALDLSDYRKLEELLIRYTWFVDTDPTLDNLSTIFTQDAVIDGPHGFRSGVDGIRETALGMQLRHSPDKVKGRHVLSNVLIDGDGDYATIVAYFVWFVTPADPSQRKEFTSGVYDCSARRVGGEWRIEKRAVTLDAPDSD